MQSALGTVESVINQSSARGSFPIALIKIDGWAKAERFAFFGNSERENIFNAVGKRIEFSYDEKQNGKYINRQLQTGWSYLPASQQQASPAKVVAAPTGQEKNEANRDGRQESIERQSAMNQAVNLVTAMLAQGISFVPQDGGKKAKLASVDPEVIFESVKQFARRIKDDVQSGDWKNLWTDTSKQAVEAAPEGDDIPF